MAGKDRIMMISTHGYFSAEPELGLPDTGGQVIFVLELAKCLGRMGYKVDIFTRQFNKKRRIERVNERVRVINIPCGGKEFIPKEFLHEHIPEWVENAHHWIKQKGLQYGLIDSHYWDAGLAGGALAQRLNALHVHTPHSVGSWKRDNMDGNPDELENKYNFRTRIREEKVIYEECDALIATTPAQRDVLINGEYDVPTDKIYVIPPGYDDTRFFIVSRVTREALKKQYGYHGKIILSLGRIARNKGYDLLIRAMVPVFKRVKDAKLLLAVGGKEKTNEEKRAIQKYHAIARELRFGRRVLFRDHIPEEALGDYYRLADVFALSSRYEPFGMTAVEAMACGTPTIITTEGGLWEQLQWGTEAIYANPFDTEAFGHAICNVLRYPRVAQQLSRQGAQRARASFTWMGIAQQTLNAVHGFRMRAKRQRAGSYGREEGNE